MKKNAKRSLALLLCLLMAGSTVACGGTTEENTPAADTAETTPVETEPAETTRNDVSDELPEKKWNGQDFRILAADYLADDLIAEEQSGALINDAVYNRNLAVEERFDVTLVSDCSNANNVINGLVKSAVMAGDNSTELLLQHMIDCANLASQNLFMDWNEVPYIDVTKPWWLTSVADNLSVAGKSYLIIGSISSYYTSHNYVVYFNKALATDYGIGDELYDTVLDGTWTIDKYASLISEKYQDLNGDGKKDEGDFYGLAAQVTSYATPFIYSFGEVTVSRDEEGIPFLDMDQEKFTAIIEKLYALFYENDTITTTGWGLHGDTFLDSRALFMNGVLWHSFGAFSEFEDDYGILPFPKWDEAQENYYTMSDGSSPLAAIPITVADPEFSGMITEALAAESWKKVDPAIFDVALKVRGVRDQRSLDAINLAISGSVSDFGFVYGNYSAMGFVVSDLMGNKKNNFASHFASKKASWEKMIDDVVKSYTEE